MEDRLGKESLKACLGICGHAFIYKKAATLFVSDVYRYGNLGRFFELDEGSGIPCPCPQCKSATNSRRERERLGVQLLDSPQAVKKILLAVFLGISEAIQILVAWSARVELPKHVDDARLVGVVAPRHVNGSWLVRFPTCAIAVGVAIVGEENSSQTSRSV